MRNLNPLQQILLVLLLLVIFLVIVPIDSVLAIAQATETTVICTSGNRLKPHW